MFKPCFFVQNNYIERVTAPVAIYARDNGIDLVDRSCFDGFDPDHIDIDWSQYHPILPVGSVQFLKILRNAATFQPYIHHDEESFSSPRVLEAFGSQLLNHAGCLVKVADVPAMLVNNEMHIRPSHVDKAFTAKIFDMERWSVLEQERHLESDLLCWASPVHKITGEWRCWVINGKVIDISRYRQGERMAINRDVPKNVWDYASEQASGWLPAPVVVMDIAETEEGLKIIEFNPFHSSGWYAGDVNNVLTAWLAWSRKHYCE